MGGRSFVHHKWCLLGHSTGHGATAAEPAVGGSRPVEDTVEDHEKTVSAERWEGIGEM